MSRDRSFWVIILAFALMIGIIHPPGVNSQSKKTQTPTIIQPRSSTPSPAPPSPGTTQPTAPSPGPPKPSTPTPTIPPQQGQWFKSVVEIRDIIALALFSASLVALIQTARFRRQDRRLEITRIYLERYGKLATEAPLAKNDKEKKEIFYQTYWFLQQEQYLFRKRNLIDKDFFDIWMNYRIVEWNDDSIFGINEYREYFSKIKKMLLPEFCSFIEGVFKKQSFGKFRLLGQVK